MRNDQNMSQQMKNRQQSLVKLKRGLNGFNSLRRTNASASDSLLHLGVAQVS